MKQRLHALCWAFSLAWKINKVMLIASMLLMSLVSVLPAVALNYNREIIMGLNTFLSDGLGTFDGLLPTIIIFGIVTALVGLSNRLNVEFIYSIMFDSYYFGMEEVLMDSMQHFTMEELLNKDASDEFFSIARREGSLTDFISGVCSLLGKFIGIVSLLIVAFSISKPVFVISVVYVIGITWLNLIFVDKLRYSWLKIRDKERLAAHYEDMPYSPEYAKELRIFESRDMLLKNWKEAYAHIYKFEVKNSFAVELRAFLSGFGFYIFLSAMILFSIYSVANGTMSDSVLLVIFTLCMNIFSSITGIAQTLIVTDHGIYALERQHHIFGLRKNSEKITGVKNSDGFGGGKGFETKELSYKYNGKKHALNNVSITINQGETVALVGLNGSGKSTLVKTLMQLYNPSHGKLYFCGKDYDELDDGFLKNRIGAFFQDYYLFHLPIWENVGFGDIDNIDNMKKIELALEKGGASSFVSRLPGGINSFVYKWIEESGADFSGGERQKIAVSRAHMSDKDILIFDEPASMLDPISELEQFMNIKEKLEGRTAILISHRVGFARLADKIILLSDGEVAETGTHDELMAQNGLYARFFREQAEWYKNDPNTYTSEAHRND